MVARLIWSLEALDDIDAIAGYISRDSPYHAQGVVDAILALEDAILAHPKAGRIVPELEDAQVRERFIYSYRVLYEIREQHIEVLAVIHGKRLLESMEDRFD